MLSRDIYRWSATHISLTNNFMDLFSSSIWVRYRLQIFGSPFFQTDIRRTKTCSEFGAPQFFSGNFRRTKIQRQIRWMAAAEGSKRPKQMTQWHAGCCRRYFGHVTSYEIRFFDRIWLSSFNCSEHESDIEQCSFSYSSACHDSRLSRVSCDTGRL